MSKKKAKKVAKKVTKKRAPAKKKAKKKVSKKKLAKTNVEYIVTAYYPTKKVLWGSLDDKIVKAAGRWEIGAGTMLSTGVRDIDFSFKNKETAEKAAKRIRKIKGVSRVTVHKLSY